MSTPNLHQLLKSMLDQGASDLHVAQNSPPQLRIDGNLVKLRLDNLEGALKGSADNKVIEPGNSAKSMLVHNISQLGDADTWMPPKDNKAKIPPLTKDEIGLVRAWIDQGAK